MLISLGGTSHQQSRAVTTVTWMSHGSHELDKDELLLEHAWPYSAVAYILAGSGGEVGRTAPGTAAAPTANLKLDTAVAGGEDGLDAPDVAVTGASSATAGTAHFKA